MIVLSPASAPAFPKNGGTEVSTGTAPPGGALLTHTDPIPEDATQGSVALEPIAGTDPTAFDDITAALVDDFPSLKKVSKRNQARLACALISYLPIANKPQGEPITFSDVNLQVAFLNVCLRMAQSIPNPAVAADRARGATAACGRVDAAVTVRVTRVKSRFVVTVISKIGRASHPRLTVSCARKGHGLRLALRPRARGHTLRQAAGPGLGIAYNNPTKKPVGIRTTFRAN
ncbi:MAG TPA: hypothetical protein VGH24_10480 [Solirubrobacteraceae bacterium]